MGNYIFKTSTLVDFLVSDSIDEKSQHDFGSNIIPKMRQAGCRILAFPFDGYWRDVGTMQSYFDANMDFNKENPPLNLQQLYSEDWKIRNIAGDMPPTRLILDGSISTISPNCDIRGTIRNCVINPEVEIAKGAVVENSIIFSRVSIGPGCQIRNAIIDKDNYLSQDTKIGSKNLNEITVVPKGKYQK